MTTALIVVDVQVDFCEGGALPVTGGNKVANSIATWLGLRGSQAAGRGIKYVVATRDHHISPGDHFSETPDYVNSWPPHCLAGTPGADLHPALRNIAFDAVFLKGERSAAYSGFEATIDGDPTSTSLHEWLAARGVTRVIVCGLATDYCVRATAMDANALGYHTTVDLTLSAAVNPSELPRIIEQLETANTLITH